jgi:hypothetical protein
MIGVCRYSASLDEGLAVRWGTGVTFTYKAEQVCLQALSAGLPSRRETGTLKSP